MIWWKWKRRILRTMPVALRFIALAAVFAFGSYLVHYWLIHSGRWSGVGRQAFRWTHPGHHAPPKVDTPAASYVRAFERCMQKLRWDPRVPLFAYAFPSEALRYQGAAVESRWRLQARSPWVDGFAVPRALHGILDLEGIVYIDPQKVPTSALENRNTPLKVDRLRRDFVLVPNVEGDHGLGYQIVPLRLLGSRSAVK